VSVSVCVCVCVSVSVLVCLCVLKHTSRVSASRMQYRDDDEEEDAAVLERRQLQAREQDREARERARLAKMAGALNGEFAPPLPINPSHTPAAGFSVRPDRWVRGGARGCEGVGE
jgi:hypothetical protein